MVSKNSVISLTLFSAKQSFDKVSYLILEQLYSQDATVLNFDFLYLRVNILQLIYKTLTLKDLAKDNMLSIEVRCGHGCDEKLRPIGVWACICHRQQVWLRVTQLEVLVLKCPPIN